MSDKIQGDTLVLGIGKSGEPYEGIGRGELNIEGMPVYRDAMAESVHQPVIMSVLNWRRELRIC